MIIKVIVGFCIAFIVMGIWLVTEAFNAPTVDENGNPIKDNLLNE